MKTPANAINEYAISVSLDKLPVGGVQMLLKVATSILVQLIASAYILILWPSSLACAQAPSPTPVVKSIYLANDDHTDYMWSADEATYKNSFITMIDYYLNQVDSTASNPSAQQGRFNLDSSFWVWVYEHNKTPSEVQRLMNRIKDGHFSVPLNPLVLTPGGMPAEAFLRGMYYAGQLERRFSFRIPLAVAMENQTLAYGIAGLWAGAGAKYSWRGVCNCATRVSGLTGRDREVYWMSAPDGSKILMKWNSINTNQSIGGYAEANNPSAIVDYVDTNSTFLSRWPYNVIGAFGYGWDNLQTTTTSIINAAQTKTTSTRNVIVSNEADFFQDFEARYGNVIPTFGASFGNEWDLYSASMSELSAGVKRSLEKLRAAEALESVVSTKDPSIVSGRQTARDLAMLDFGIYFEHDWTADGPVLRADRATWERKVAGEISSYVDTLYSDSLTRLGTLISNPSAGQRFFVFNSLGWVRTDFADLNYNGSTPVHVIDTSLGSEVPSQIVNFTGQKKLRILASGVPALGYKTFEIQSGAGASYPQAATVTGGVIENPFYKLTVSNSGSITSFLDKTRSNREFVKSGSTLNDAGLLNANSPASDVFSVLSSGSLSVENIGPVSTTLVSNSTSPFNHTTRLTLFRDLNRVELINQITQNFGDIRGWRFALNLSSNDLWHEEVGAVIRAKLLASGGHYSPKNARYDWITINHFADMSGSGSVGMTISNPDLYFMRYGSSSTSSLDTTSPQIEILGGGQVDGGTFGIPNQGGDSLFTQRFALRPHDDFDQTAAMKFSLEHQNPFIASEIAAGGSALPPNSYSLVSISNPKTLLWAFKPADDGLGQGYLMRLWNQDTANTTTEISIPNGSLTGAQIVTHIETPLSSLNISNGKLSDTINRQQIKSYQIKFALNGNDTIAPDTPKNLTIQ